MAEVGHNNHYVRRLALKWLVYLLECSDGSYYCGCTNALDRRIMQHNEGTGAKYTRGRRPVILKSYSEVFETRAEAQQVEARCKKLPKHEKEEFLLSTFIHSAEKKAPAKKRKR